MLLAGCRVGLPGAEGAHYLDPDRPLKARLDDLIGRMTLEEKASQMVDEAPAIPRLGIPAYNWWNEALHGVARAGRATVFPQAIGLGATWNKELVGKMATAISDEARAKYHAFQRRGKRDRYQGLTLWSPNINIFRDPRWGRGMETYGEDPHLTGQLGVAFIKGLQGDDPKYLKAVATPKHFAVHSGPEPERHGFDAITDERDLRETYLPQFQVTIQAARAASLMCAYNRYRGEAACGSHRLLTEILRDEWGFDGFVVSDCGAIKDFYAGHKLVRTAAEASALGVRAGCDLSCGPEYASLVEAVQKKLVSEAEVDRSLKRLFAARFKLGMFDPQELVPWSKLPTSVVDSPAHAQLALQVARESIVLLKNENGTLPLAQPKTIAVVGPLADDPFVGLANYYGIPSRMVTVRQGIAARAPQGTRLLYAAGSAIAEGLPVLAPVPASALRPPGDGQGLRGAYFKNRKHEGQPAQVRVDAQLDFMWWDRGPVPGFDEDDFSVRWEGDLVAPAGGRYALGVRAQSAYELTIDGKRLLKRGEGNDTRLAWETIELGEGPHALRIDLTESTGDASFQLFWAVPRPQAEMQAEAVSAARQADVVVAVLGLTPWLEGEQMKVPVPGFRGGDRVSLDLPEPQQQLLHALAHTGKPVVLVLMSGGALTVRWAAEHIPAIVEAWYAGQAGGEAMAEVLFGAYNPAGRLPVTFYRSVDDLPPFVDYAMKGRTYRYFGGDVLWPFGHGLSYTKFAYSDLKATVASVSVAVQNVGDRDGDEVVQVYVRDVEASVPVPLRALKAFMRVHLKRGEKRSLTFALTPDDFSLIDANNKRVVEPGQFEIKVGGLTATVVR